MFEQEGRARKFDYFDHDKAKEYGIETSIVFTYLWRIWHFERKKEVSIKDILNRYPYLRITDVDKAFDTLTDAGLLKVDPNGGKGLTHTFSMKGW